MADSLYVRLVADLSRYTPGLAQAGRQATQFGAQAQQALDRAARATAALAAAQRTAAADAGKIASAQARLAAAQARLNQAQASGSTSAARLAQANAAVVAAQNALATAQGKAAHNAQAAAKAQADLADATKRAAQAQQDHASSSRLSATAAVALGTAVGNLAGQLGGKLIGALKGAVTAGLEFDTAMRNVNSITGLSETGFGALSKQVLELSNRTGASATDVAKAMYDIASSGFQAGDGLKVATAAIDASRAGMTDAATAAQAVTAVLNAYHLGAGQAADVSDTLFQTVNLGVTSFETLAHNVGDYIGQAGALGASFAQTQSAIATLTDNGVAAGEAGTVLGSILNALIKPGEGLANALHKAGYESGTAAVKAVGLRGVLMALQKQTGGSAEAMGELFSDTTALRGALALTANEGQKYAQNAQAIETANGRAGATAKALAEQNKALSAQLQILRTRVANIGIEAWEKILPGAARALAGVNASSGQLGDALVRLQPLWQAIGTLVRNDVTQFSALASAAAPVVTVLAKLAAVTVVGFLTGLAKVLAATSGFMADHTGLVKALATVYLARYVPAVVAATVAQASLVGTNLTLWAIKGSAAIGSLIVGLQGLTAASAGAAVGTAAAWAGATAGISLVIADVVHGIGAISSASGEAKKKIGDINKGVDLSDPGSISKGREQLKAYIEQQRDAARSGGFFGQVFHGLTGDVAAHINKMNDAKDALAAYDTKMARVNSNIHTLGMSYDLNREQVVKLAAAHHLDLNGSIDELLPQIGALVAASRGEAVAHGEVSAAAKDSAAALQTAATAIGLTALSADDAKKRNEDLATSMAGFVDPVGIYTGLLDTAKTKMQEQAQAVADGTQTGKDSWQDYATSVSVSLDAYNKKLQEQVTAQENWRTNLLTIAKKVSPDMAIELAKLGPQAATLVGQVASASGPQLDKFVTLFRQKNKNAVDAGNGQLVAGFARAAVLAKTGGKTTADALAAALGVGVGQVAAIAKQYGITIEANVTPVLKALGKTLPGYSGAVGGSGPTAGKHILNADGNLLENHTAQIAPAGAWRVWAEPETGGEAYIPLAASKRSRSVSIWKETGKRLGQTFATGGVVPPVPSLKPYSGMVAAPGQAAMDSERAAALALLAQNAAADSGVGGSSSGLTKHALQVRAQIMDLFGVHNIGGWRPPGDGYNEHSTGRALDVMVGLDNPLGGRIADWAIKNAADIGLKWVIWQQRIAHADGHWRKMADRGSPTQNHRDHDHIFLNQARGGILNPHIRDSGGPLLPGFTYNGTGRPEMVLPLAAGGIVASAAKAPPSVAAAQAAVARATADADAARKAAQAEKDHNAQLAAHNRLIAARNRLAAEQRKLEDLRHDLAIVKTAVARADTLRLIAEQSKKVAAAQQAVNAAEGKAATAGRGGNPSTALADAKKTLAAARAAEAAAKRAAAQAKAHAKHVADDYAAAVDRQRNLEDNMYATGVLSAAKYDALLAKRLAHEKKYSDAYMSILRTRQQVAQDVADKAAKQIADRNSLEDNQYAVGARTTAQHLADLDRRIKAEKKYSDEWTRLTLERTQLVQDEADKQKQAIDDARSKQESALGTLNDLLDREAELRKQAADAAETYRQAQTSAAQALAKAEQDASAARQKALEEFEAKRADLLRGRSDALVSWAKLDEQASIAWGNSVDQLLDNARRQAEEFAEWQSRLADARSRGVSESVIASLGLDQGPQALGQLRQFSTATVAQIDSLNAAVAQRQTAASQQASMEAAAGLGDLGVQLTQATRDYTDTLAQIQADYADAVAQANDELAKAQADLLATQADVAGQLAALGSDQGRGYADAVAAGIRSGIPGILAAAREAQAAMQALNAAQAAATAQPVGSPTVAAPTPSGIGTIAQNAALHVDPASLPKRTSANDRLISATAPAQLTARQIAYAGLYGLTLRTYDAGGPLQPGYTLAYNGTGKTEHVLTAEQAGSRGGSTEVRVFIGDRELTDIVDVQIGSTLGARRTAVNLAGAR